MSRRAIQPYPRNDGEQINGLYSQNSARYGQTYGGEDEVISGRPSQERRYDELEGSFGASRETSLAQTIDHGPPQQQQSQPLSSVNIGWRPQEAYSDYSEQGTSSRIVARDGSGNHEAQGGIEMLEVNYFYFNVHLSINITLSYNADFGSMKAIFRSIQRDWAEMVDSNCVPVQLALQFMDSSSLGRANQTQQFQETYAELQRALKAIVNDHHEGFSNSIGLYHRIKSSMQASQQRIRSLKDSMTLAKCNLSTTKPEFKRLAVSSQEYEDMLQALSRIEQLQLVPEVLEARISEKRFLTAVDVLQDALRIVRAPEMEQIGGLADLKVYVINQETSVVDILVEELHSHLYLKSPYSQGRWRFSIVGPSNGTSQAEKSVPAVLSPTKPLDTFLESLNLSSPITDDASRNPEADNFSYIQLLLEAFSKLGRLSVATESIEQRMPIELFRLVDRTYFEVNQRRRNAAENTSEARGGRGGIDIFNDGVREIVITDFLNTLYSKLEAIAEGHRVVHDVIIGIAKRDGIQDPAPLTNGFKELWKLYQNEIRTILHDYLATDGRSAFRSGHNQAGNNNVLKRTPRDKSKMLFKFSNTADTEVDLVSAQDDLKEILRLSVPGLILESRHPFGSANKEHSVQSEVSATGHKLLAQPSVFNMSYLLRPSLTFIRRLGDIVPTEEGSPDIAPSRLTSFLDDFLINVFQPQLDETLSDSSIQILIGLDSFQMDSQWFSIAKRPIFKGTAAFYNLVATFARLLDSIPHDQAFTQPIISQMITYYDKCRGFYKSLITRPQSHVGGGIRLKAAAAVSENDAIRETAAKLWTGSREMEQELLEREARSLIAYTQELPLEAVDVISDRKSIISLCLLYTSMKWLAAKISHLRRVVEPQASILRWEDEERLAGHWALHEIGRSRIDEGSLYLPLTKEIAGSFDAVIDSYQELASLVLFTLHMEIRCEVILRICGCLQSNYMLDQPITEPDAAILDLNSDLIKFDEDLITYLRPQEHKLVASLCSSLISHTIHHLTMFITTGIGLLIDTVLVTNTSRITSMNANGCRRMQLNMLVLQQNLKNVESEVVLKRSAQYYDLFAAGPDAIIARIKAAHHHHHHHQEGTNSGVEVDAGPGRTQQQQQQQQQQQRRQDLSLPFSHEELKFLIELSYSESLTSDRREAAMQANRALQDHLSQLNEFTRSL